VYADFTLSPASACKSHEAGTGCGCQPTATDNLAGCFSLWIVRHIFTCKMSGNHKQTALDLAQKIIVIINHTEAGKKQQQLRLLVIIVVTKYYTLTARFLNARLLK